MNSDFFSSQAKGSDLLGDFTVVLSLFQNLEKDWQFYSSAAFFDLSEKEKYEKVHSLLCEKIIEADEPCFLLAAVLEYIDQVHKHKILAGYSFAHFELWLNQFSPFSKEENYRIRAKIAGRFVPRETYQSLFPIGMGKVYSGSHYVTAHSSPDLDTTVASFWGWLDAFSCRVSEGLHVWNLPSGAPRSQVEIGYLFDNIFGSAVFDCLAKTRTALSLSSIDVMSQKGMVKALSSDPSSSADHARDENAIVVVDQAGRFLGDWRAIDVEGVQQVISLWDRCLNALYKLLTEGLYSLLASPSVTKEQIFSFIKGQLDEKIQSCQPIKAAARIARERLDAYLAKIVLLPTGLSSTFADFFTTIHKKGHPSVNGLIKLLTSMQSHKLFDADGTVIEDRRVIFTTLASLAAAFEEVQEHLRIERESLSTCLAIKKEVFGFSPQGISFRSEVEEIRSKMEGYSSLTVLASDEEGAQFPIGVVYDHAIAKPTLGTVSLRDFCNRDETKIPSYFEVISVIDHHKTSLATSAAPVVFLSDQQSSNSLVATKAFEINDPFSLQGQRQAAISEQLDKHMQQIRSQQTERILQRLLQISIAAKKGQGFFIDPRREYVEYLHYLFAILDDTDLLSKVSIKDLECIAALLNRMKSIALGEVVEIIHFDDIAYDADYAANCTKRILQNLDMYSLYSKVYHLKEEAVDQSLKACADGNPSMIFADTKQQNGCCRVGQSKLYAKNFPTFLAHAAKIRSAWQIEALAYYSMRREVDLHIHMISTVPGAEDMFTGKRSPADHKDEMWIWIPQEEVAIERLKSFLHAFKQQPAIMQGEFELEFQHKESTLLQQIFKESFIDVPMTVVKTGGKEELSLAILRYKPGLLNSRKAMVSPFLPKLVN